MEELKPPLSNIQIELLKLYATDLSDEELAELKELLSTFYANKAIRHAYQFWTQKIKRCGDGRIVKR